MADGGQPLVQGAFEMPTTPPPVVETVQPITTQEAVPAATPAETQAKEKAKQDKKKANGFWGRLFHRKAQETRNPYASIQEIADGKVPFNAQMEAQMRLEMKQNGQMDDKAIEVQIQRLRHEGVNAEIPHIPSGPEASPVNQTEELIKLAEKRVREPDEEAKIREGYRIGLPDAQVEYMDHLTYDQLKAYKEQNDAFLRDPLNKNKQSLAAERSKYAGYRLMVLEGEAQRAKQAAEATQAQKAAEEAAKQKAEADAQAEHDREAHSPSVDHLGPAGDAAEGSVEAVEFKLDLDDARERLRGYDRLLAGIDTLKANKEMSWDSVEKQLIEARLAAGQDLAKIEGEIRIRRDMLDKQIASAETRQQEQAPDEPPAPEPAPEAPPILDSQEKIEAAIADRIKKHVKDRMDQWKQDHPQPKVGTPDYDTWCDQLADLVDSAEMEEKVPAAMRIWEEQNPGWSEDPAKVKERKAYRQQMMNPNSDEAKAVAVGGKEASEKKTKKEPVKEPSDIPGPKEIKKALSNPETNQAVRTLAESMTTQGSNPELQKKRADAQAVIEKNSPRLGTLLKSAAGISALVAVMLAFNGMKAS